MAVIAIPPGSKVLTPRLACQKLSKKKSWLWDRVRNDPRFPKPIYTSPRSPLFIEAELDAYIAKLAEARAQVSEHGA